MPSADPAGPGADPAAGPRLSPALIATLVAVPVTVLIVFIAFAALHSAQVRSTPIDSYATAPSPAGTCSALLAAAPDHFDGFDAKKIDGDTARWGSTRDETPLTLRCGVARPSALSPSSGLQEVYPVQWFLTEGTSDSGQAFVAVDHRPYVALWIPLNSGNGPITDISGLIEKKLPKAPLDFG